MRIVLDANVLGPGFMLESGVSWEVVNAWREDQFEVVISDHLLSEISTTLAKPYWRSRFPIERAERALLTIRRRGIRVVPTPGVDRIATHWQDDMVIATAIAGDATYLVTGDKELLRLKSYKDVAIVSPLEFLEILRAETDADPDD